MIANFLFLFFWLREHFMNKLEYICFVKLKLGPIGVTKGLIPIAKLLAIVIFFWSGTNIYDLFSMDEYTSSRGTTYTRIDSPIGFWIRVVRDIVLCVAGLFYSIVGIVDGSRMKDIKEKVGPYD